MCSLTASEWREKTFPSNAVSYYFSDHLKTASVITDAAGNIKSESDFYPWGGELQFVNNDSNHYKFTGKERDTESGLDYLRRTVLHNGLGRFVTPDWSSTPVPVPYAVMDDPQSLNLYSYVRNNPLTKTDPTGHCPWCLAAAGGGVLADEAPLALTGPVGWTIIGVTAVGVLAVTAYEHFHQDAPASAATPAPAATPGPVSTPTSGQQVPTQAPGFVGDAGGNIVPIPAGSTARPADNGNGVVYQPPVPAGAHPDANAVRVMGPTTAQPTGSVTVHGPTGQPINPATGKPDSRDKTHTPIVPAPTQTPFRGNRIWFRMTEIG